MKTPWIDQNLKGKHGKGSFTAEKCIEPTNRSLVFQDFQQTAPSRDYTKTHTFPFNPVTSKN